MKCPKCGAKCGVTNTAIFDHIVWRTRKCPKCAATFETSEIEDEAPAPMDQLKREANDK